MKEFYGVLDNIVISSERTKYDLYVKRISRESEKLGLSFENINESGFVFLDNDIINKLSYHLLDEMTSIDFPLVSNIDKESKVAHLYKLGKGHSLLCTILNSLYRSGIALNAKSGFIADSEQTELHELNIIESNPSFDDIASREEIPSFYFKRIMEQGEDSVLILSDSGGMDDLEDEKISTPKVISILFFSIIAFFLAFLFITSSNVIQDPAFEGSNINIKDESICEEKGVYCFEESSGDIEGYLLKVIKESELLPLRKHSVKVIIKNID